MQMPTHAACRDKRAALYLDNPKLFLQMLGVELSRLIADAEMAGLQPAARLNGSSDLSWESLHPGLFRDFPSVAFFDYTKVYTRMKAFLRDDDWPNNYHLTFSAAPGNHEMARQVLDSGGNVALVFWPKVPASFWGFRVIDGDNHDARFLDSQGVVVGLSAKGLARVDRSGFTVRPCPHCGPLKAEMELVSVAEDRYVTTVHRCRSCGFELRQRMTSRFAQSKTTETNLQQAA
jgi:hypothetical protein